MSDQFFEAMAHVFHGQGAKVIYLGEQGADEVIDGQFMRITRRSPLNGKVNEMTLHITPEQWAMYASGRHVIQQCFPHLSDSEREFILSGYTDQDWNELFTEDDDCREC